jgi:hypothetical protein
VNPGDTILHYRLIRKIGEGGMGVVYQAEDTRLCRMVALKFVSHVADAPRLLAEARAAASLSHPDICTLFEVDEAHSFLAMEYIAGETLTDRIARREKYGSRPGEALKVEAVLEGSLQRSGDRLRIGMNLLRVNDGASLWAETFIRRDDIFAVQDEVARRANIWTLLAIRRVDEASGRVKKEMASIPNNGIVRGQWMQYLALKGRFRETEQEIPKIEQLACDRSFHHATFSAACVYGLQGKAAQAVEWLRKTSDYGMPNYTLFSRSPHFERIRADPAYIAFMEELKKRYDGFQREFQ